MALLRKVEPKCMYCGRCNREGEVYTCSIKSKAVQPEEHCMRFKYDPLMRIPSPRAEPDFTRFRDEDFSI